MSELDLLDEMTVPSLFSAKTIRMPPVVAVNPSVIVSVKGYVPAPSTSMTAKFLDTLPAGFAFEPLLAAR